MLKGGDLSLRLRDIDRREQPLFNLTPVARVLLLGETHGLSLHVQIPAGEFEFPVRLHGLGHRFDEMLAQLFDAEVYILTRNFNAVARVIELQSAPQRLGEIQIQPRAVLRIQKGKLAIRDLPGGREIDLIAAAGPR